MKYFHRTSVPIRDVLSTAESYFGKHLASAGTDKASRSFEGTLGKVKLTAQAEGGHYTLVTAVTSEVGESELDKLVKRFLGTVHQIADSEHELRGAY